MLQLLLLLVVLFIVSWLISATVIFLASKFFVRRSRFSTALLASFIGAVIFSLSYFFINSGFWASLVAGVGWLFALRKLYRVGWIRALLITLMIWVINFLLGIFIPLFFLSLLIF